MSRKVFAHGIAFVGGHRKTLHHGVVDCLQMVCISFGDVEPKLAGDIATACKQKMQGCLQMFWTLFAVRADIHAVRQKMFKGIGHCHWRLQITHNIAIACIRS